MQINALGSSLHTGIDHMDFFSTIAIFSHQSSPMADTDFLEQILLLLPQFTS